MKASRCAREKQRSTHPQTLPFTFVPSPTSTSSSHVFARETAALGALLRTAAPPLVMCPLGFERHTFTGFGKLPSMTTGVGADNIRDAFAQRHRWPIADPSMVILLGTCGALSREVRAGSDHLVREVRAIDGRTLRSPLLARGISSEQESTIVESPTVMHCVTQKRELHEASRAQLVDMESFTFAQCAIDAGLPWAVVRGVSDDATHTLPAECAGFLDARGETRIARVLASIIRRPRLALELVPLARNARRAMRHASFTADALGCLDATSRCSAQNPLLLYGGSFDPPHMRHATMLEEAMLALHAPCAIVMPAAINPLKSDTPRADASARLAMCAANFSHTSASCAGEIRLSALELTREGPSYTIDTVQQLLNECPELKGALRFLVGSDAMRELTRWHRWRDLLTLATPAVVLRAPETRDAAMAFLGEFGRENGFADSTSWLLPLDAIEVSSTHARESIARGERPSEIADEVWREISRRGLYGFVATH